MIDIFSGDPILKPTLEHVLLNSLGGRLQVIGLVDEDTNIGFGKGIDAALGQAVQPIRLLLNAKGDRGGSPATLNNIPLADGRQATMESGGRVTLAAPRVIPEINPDGKLTRIHGLARSDRELAQLTKRLRKEHSIALNDLLASTQHRSEAVTVQVSVTFTSDAQRCIAKMAAVLYAQARPDSFRSSAFNNVRRYVYAAETSEPHVMPLPTTVDYASNALGPVDHLLLVHEDGSTGCVEALVALFGELHFGVYLGNAPLPNAGSWSYRIDQISGRDRSDDHHDLALTVPSFQHAVANPQQCLEGFAQANERLKGIVITLRDQLRRAGKATHGDTASEG